MDDLQIPEIDRERIESLVETFRRSVENLYRMGYIQGQIDQSEETIKRLHKKEPA